MGALKSKSMAMAPSAPATAPAERMSAKPSSATSSELSKKLLHVHWVHPPKSAAHSSAAALVHAVFVIAEVVPLASAGIREYGVRLDDQFELLFVTALHALVSPRVLYFRQRRTLSGWCLRLSRLYAFLISISVQSRATPRIL